MNGELGVIYQDGKQVGGIYDWEVDIIPIPTIQDGWREYKIKKEITAKSYWLTNAPANNQFDIQLLKVVRGQLVVMDGGKVKIDLPNKTLDRRIDIPLQIWWVGN